jgi:hypothetical protein
VAAILVSTPTARRWTPIALPVLRLPRDILQIAPLVLALLASPAIYLSVTSEAVTTGATVERLRTEREQWRQQNRQLEYELAKLQSLAWVENEAVTRLGMRRAMPAIYMIVDRSLPARPQFASSTRPRRESETANSSLTAPGVGELAATEFMPQVASR